MGQGTVSQTSSVHLQGFENAAHEYDAKINATTKKLLSLRNISPVRSFIFHQLQQVKNCHFFSPIKFQRQEMLLLEKRLRLKMGQQAFQEIIVPKILFQTQMQENVKHARLATSKTRGPETEYTSQMHFCLFLINKKTLKILSIPCNCCLSSV